MIYYRQRLQVCILTMAIMLGLAIGAHALSAVDSTGKVVGEVLHIGFNWISVVRFHDGTPYVIVVERQRVAGTASLWYETVDCTGQPYLLSSFPVDDVPDLINGQSGIGPDGQIYIPILGTILEPTLYSLWSFRQERNCVQLLDETGEDFDPLEEWAWEAEPVGSISEFVGPFNVK